MGPLGDLHGRGIGIAVHGDDLDTQSLGLDGHFLTEFAGTEQHKPRGGLRQRRTEDRHGNLRELRVERGKLQGRRDKDKHFEAVRSSLGKNSGRCSHRAWHAGHGGSALYLRERKNMRTISSKRRS
jgi:hypothetical protein